MGRSEVGTIQPTSERLRLGYTVHFYVAHSIKGSRPECILVKQFPEWTYFHYKFYASTIVCICSHIIHIYIYQPPTYSDRSHGHLQGGNTKDKKLKDDRVIHMKHSNTLSYVFETMILSLLLQALRCVLCFNNNTFFNVGCYCI